MKWFDKLLHREQPSKQTPGHSVVTVFNRLINNRSPINLTFRNSKKQYSTIILEVNLKDNYFLLDELIPNDGNILMKEAVPFQAISSDKGITVKLSASAFEHGIDNDIAFYKIPIPDNIDYQQRRNAYRLQASSHIPITITLPTALHGTLYGKIDNISLTGIRILCDHNIAHMFEKDEILTHCHLYLPESDMLDVDLIIRHVNYETGKMHTVLGARFVKISPAQQAQINHFMSALQREQMRKL